MHGEASDASRLPLSPEQALALFKGVDNRKSGQDFGLVRMTRVRLDGTCAVAMPARALRCWGRQTGSACGCSVREG